MKKGIILLLVLLTVLTAGAVQADDLADVMQNGVLRMGTAPEYVPFVFYDENDSLTGIDVALLEEIARRMGVKLQTIDIAFDGLLDALEIGQVDIIGRGMAKTASRQERIDFTRVYYRGDAQFIALSSLAKPASVDHSSFKGLKIGVQKATSFEQWIRDNLISDGSVNAKDVYLYANAEDLMKALDRKDVDLIVLDEDIYESLYRPTGQYQVFYVGFLEENYAFGLRKGSTLTDVVNGHLLNMLKDGTAQKIAEGFFSRDYTNTSQAEIVRPTQAPTAVPVIPTVVIPTQAPAPAPAACINSMTFTADVTIPDGHQVSPGEHFRKIWRVYNNGTCTWTPAYSFVYVSGNRMSGNDIVVPVNVAPGQTVDLAVDFIAPNDPATYKGYWQMRAPQGTNFGETIWVKVRVPGSQPVYPTPTPEDGQHYVPITINSFYADSYEGYPESCVTVHWSTKGASAVEILVDGSSVHQWDDANGSRRICDRFWDPGAYNIQLHALNVVTDAWSSFTYTSIKHPTGLIFPDGPDDAPGDYHPTGLIVP